MKELAHVLLSQAFIAIGLNFSDHAAEAGAKPPSEPIIFMKATSSINGLMITSKWYQVQKNWIGKLN